MHMNVGAYRSQRCWVLLEVQFQVSVSHPMWVLGTGC